MCAKGRIRHEACLHSRACNLPCHVFVYIYIYIYYICTVQLPYITLQECNLTTSVLEGQDVCAKGRIRHEACLHSRARNLPCHVLLMSIGEDSKSQLGGKHIYKETHGDQRRTAEAARRHLSRQRENDSWHRLLQNVRLNNAHINGTPHLPPSCTQCR